MGGNSASGGGLVLISKVSGTHPTGMHSCFSGVYSPACCTLRRYFVYPEPLHTKHRTLFTNYNTTRVSHR